METARFAFRNRTLSLRADEPVIGLAKAAFREIAAPAGGHAGQHAQVLLSDEETRVLFDGAEVQIPNLDPSERNEFTSAFYATREIFARFAAADASCWALYGTAVRCGSGALLILGPSTIGKSVLTAHLLACGAQFYGDEIVVVDRETGYVSGMRRGLMIREPSLPLLPSAAMRERCAASPHRIQTERGALWYAVEADALVGRPTAAEPAPLGGIILLAAERAKVSALEPLPGTAAAIEAARYLYRRAGELTELGALTSLLARAPAHRLRLGPPGEAAALIVGIAGS